MHLGIWSMPPRSAVTVRRPCISALTACNQHAKACLKYHVALRRARMLTQLLQPICCLQWSDTGRESVSQEQVPAAHTTGGQSGDYSSLNISRSSSSSSCLPTSVHRWGSHQQLHQGMQLHHSPLMFRHCQQQQQQCHFLQLVMQDNNQMLTAAAAAAAAASISCA